MSMTGKKTDKGKRLSEIALEIENCSECRKGKSGLPVVGEGDPNAKVMFVGESPGPTEARTGRPFVGRSGRLLTQLLNSIGLEREKVFITSPLKFYPGRRPPYKEEIEHGKTHLQRQIEIINPKIIVLLGNVAIEAVTDRRLRISDIHGRRYGGRARYYFATFHPAAAVRFPRILRHMKDDFKALKKTLAEI